jgi:hypothetical protein
VLLLYWNSKYIRDTGFCKAALQKLTIFPLSAKRLTKLSPWRPGSLSRTKSYATCVGQGGHCNIFIKVLLFSMLEQVKQFNYVECELSLDRELDFDKKN